MYLTNWAMEYLNYSTRIVAKSSKVVPTMLMGTLLQGKRYSAAEYASAGLLVVGVSMFCLGDVQMAPNFHVQGLVLIAGALCADAGTSNFEEKRFFRIPDPVGQSEVIFYSSLFGSGAALAILFATAELGPAATYSLAHRPVVPLLSAAAVCGYVSVTCVLLLIKLYGATNTEIVKSLRKVLSIALSFAVYPRSVNAKYLLGFSATVASLALTMRLKQRKAALGSGGSRPSHSIDGSKPTVISVPP
jgi:adenosine 3'-phospho 5'-phosphosulfate transporter B3